MILIPQPLAIKRFRKLTISKKYFFSVRQLSKKKAVYNLA